MIVTLKPKGREEFALTLDGLPVYSSAVFGGYEQAQVTCQLSDEERMNALGGRLRIHGMTGIAWEGVVTRRPGRNEPLIALGKGWAATWGRRKADYCDTSLNSWPYEETTANNTSWSFGIGVADLICSIPAGTWATGTRSSVMRHFDNETSVRITGTVDLPHANTELLFYKTDNGTSSSAGTVASDGAFTIDITATALQRVFIIARTTASYSPATDVEVKISDLKVYAMGVTSVTTTNVIKDVLTDEVPVEYLPASTKIAEVAKYAAYDYGWYSEMVGPTPCTVPHWTPRSTTPDYVVLLSEAEAYDLDESGLDELSGATRVRYQSIDGRSVYTDVIDTDASHPCVALGIRRYTDLDVQTSSAATAASLGAVGNSETGREQVKGSVSTRTVRTKYGAEAYLPDVRPGSMVRVMGLPDGQRDVIAKRVTLTGDTIASLELDNEPYRLDILLSQLEKRAG
jgi:hypothetical protein